MPWGLFKDERGKVVHGDRKGRHVNSQDLVRLKIEVVEKELLCSSLYVYSHDMIFLVIFCFSITYLR